MISPDDRAEGTNESELGFWDHAEELRRRLIWVIVVFLAFAVIAFLYKSLLFDQFLFKPISPGFITFKWFCSIGKALNIDGLCVESIKVNLMNTQIAGQFRWHMIGAAIGGFVIVFPYLVHQIWRFIKPALTPAERKNIRGFTFIISGLFFLGLLFGYFILLPLTLAFLANYQISALVENHITLESYLSTVIFLPLSIGLVFELPVFVYFLSKIGLLTSQLMRKHRKHAIIVILIIAGIITPSTDMFTQVLVGIPLYLLFEASIVVAIRNEKTK